MGTPGRSRAEGRGLEAENHLHRASLAEPEGSSGHPNKGLPKGGKAPISISWRKAGGTEVTTQNWVHWFKQKPYVNYPREKPPKEYESYGESGKVITTKQVS